jgi:pseudouridine-5'-phosphate glycosidase
VGLKTAVLVAIPAPEAAALPSEGLEKAIQMALSAVEEENVRGSDVTPYMLKKVNQMTGGGSLRANLALLIRNARVGAQIARSLTQSKRFHQI